MAECIDVIRKLHHGGPFVPSCSKRHPEVPPPQVFRDRLACSTRKLPMQLSGQR